MLRSDGIKAIYESIAPIPSIRRFQNVIIVLAFGLIPAIVCQFFTPEPVDRYIHIRNFRYGKDPSVIRCNRGDKLHLTFSSDDTGHSFFLEEFDIDVKVSPAVEEVTVFRTSDPSDKPILTKELTIIAEHPGLLNYLISKSQYRCHVWCGPMHAFEQGKLHYPAQHPVVLQPGKPAGCTSDLVPGHLQALRTGIRSQQRTNQQTGQICLKGNGVLKKLLVSPLAPDHPDVLCPDTDLYRDHDFHLRHQNVGKKPWGFVNVGGLAVPDYRSDDSPGRQDLVHHLSPSHIRGPDPARILFSPQERDEPRSYNNKFFGLSLQWPEWLNNNWLRLIVFLSLATFSTTMVASPRISGLVILMLLLVPTLMAAFSNCGPSAATSVPFTPLLVPSQE